MKGLEMISSVLGPPGSKGSPGPKDPMDTNEAEEGGEGELETHLRAFNKALTGGRMTEAANAFRSAVNACGGYSGPEME